MTIIINGAGIAGPTLAYWLRKAGHEVVLVEVAPQLRTGGYVIDFGLVGYDIAEKVAKVASSALLILTAGWEVYRGWSKAKEEVRQREVALRELQGTARRATATAREQFLGRASCSVAKVLSPLI